MHVLVIEREQRLRDAVMTCLAGVGHRPVAAPSIEAALILAVTTYPWDVCLADWDASAGPDEHAYLQALAARVPLVITPRPGGTFALLTHQLGDTALALVPQPYDVETLCHLLESVGTTFAR